MRFLLALCVLPSAMLATGCPSPSEPPAKSAAEAKQEVVPSERAPQPERPDPSLSGREGLEGPGVKDDGTVVSAVAWFDGTLEAALTAAKADGKLVLLDIGAYWCPPCHRLDEEVFVRPEVGQFLAASYVAVHVDAEAGEGPDLVTRYRVQAYPTLLVLEPSGIEKGRIVDFLPADAFITAMQRIAAGHNVLQDLVAAVESDPDDAKARYALGNAYALAAAREDAEAQFEEVMLADPRDEMGLASEVMHDRAMFFRYKLDHDLQGAIESLRELQQRFPNSKAAQRAHRTIGRLYNELGDPDRAIAALDAMLATDPDDPRLAASYGWFSFREKCKPEAGLRVVTAAIARAPADAELHYLHAELEHLLGRDDAALEAIRRASELEPESAFYKRQVRRFGELAGRMMRIAATLALFGAVESAEPDAGRGSRTAEPEAGPASASEPEAEAEAESDTASEAESESEAEAESASEAEAEAEFAPARAEPARSKFRAAPPPARDYDPDSGVPPGGYWEPGEAPEIAPEDGEEELLVAYILLPLATLTTISGALNLWLTVPDHCPRRLQYVGLDATTGECRSLLVVNAIRTSYGALGVITGAVLLGIGLHRKKQYELWKKSRFRASLGVRPTGATLQIRF